MEPAMSAPSFNFWEQLRNEERATLERLLVDQSVPAGTSFIREGESGDCLYFIRRGNVEVRSRGAVIARLDAGHVVGEMALLDRKPRNADVVTATDCVLARLPVDRFHDLCGRMPSLRMVLTHLVAHRLNWSGTDVLARRIGPYEVVQQLGAGNMGWVFRAMQGNEEFALKMLPHPLVQQSHFLEHYRHEAQLLRHLDHKNIVKFHDFIELYGTVFLILEYVRGRNAEEWRVQRGRPAISDVRAITIAVARALQAAHAGGVLHCDVKPSNIMIGGDGSIKLVDFGIAASLSDPDDSDRIELTPCYAAPERFTGLRGGPEVDFYSLGVTTYHFLTGSVPFEAGSLEDWVKLHQESKPPVVQKACPNVPPDLADFVSAALLKDPGARRRGVRACLEQWSRITKPLTVSNPPLPPCKTDLNDVPHRSSPTAPTVVDHSQPRDAV